ncbi:Lrp/AsnC family transcriptional regulator [Streptomyces sp. NPDC005795]|uniref:Lrp/AsnC family transcriptional regulator n=1 Tax=Streptomyces sp. NPDC005795 TaxID=3154677 RepID=UPI0033CE0AFD
MDLDETDLAIVRGLQSDGRLTYETLAQQVGLSRPATRMRVQRLQESGAVRIVAIVHPAVHRLTASAHLAIDTDGASAPVAHAIATLPQAPFVTLTSGRRSIMVELRTAGFGELERTIEEIRAMDGVRTVDPLVATRHVKDPYLLAEEPTVAPQDDVDERILAELEEDGRLPFAELAGRVGLSAGATRTRTLRLLEGGVAKVVALVRPDVLGMGYLCGFSLRAAGAAAQVAEQVAVFPRVTFLSTCLGRAELVGTISAESLAAVRTTLEGMRELPQVREVESWLHLELIKEQYNMGPRPA